MPTYQYVCTDCNSPLEVVQSFTDDALTDCPECDGGRLRKVYGSVGVVFKGSGFYRNDSRSSSGESKGTSSGESKGTSSGESKADSSAPAAGNPSTGATSAAGHSVTPAAASTP